jgi:hypothetical protein
VLGSWKKRKEIDHPDAGRLSFDVHAWRVDGVDDIRLFLHLPCPASDTRTKLETLLRARTGRAGGAARGQLSG